MEIQYITAEDDRDTRTVPNAERYLTVQDCRKFQLGTEEEVDKFLNHLRSLPDGTPTMNGLCFGKCRKNSETGRTKTVPYDQDDGKGNITKTERLVEEQLPVHSWCFTPLIVDQGKSNAFTKGFAGNKFCPNCEGRNKVPVVNKKRPPTPKKEVPVQQTNSEGQTMVHVQIPLDSLEDPGSIIPAMLNGLIEATDNLPNTTIKEAKRIIRIQETIQKLMPKRARR